MVTHVNRQHKNYNMIFHNILIKLKKKKGLKRALETFNLSEYQIIFLQAKGGNLPNKLKRKMQNLSPVPLSKFQIYHNGSIK